MKKVFKFIPLIAIFALAVFSLAQAKPTWAAADSAAARGTVPTLNRIYLPMITNNYTAPAPLWRFGVAKARSNFADYEAAQVTAMRFGWYVDFVVNPAPASTYGMEYVPTVRVKQTKVTGAGADTDCCVTCAYKTPYTYTFSPTASQIQSLAASRPGMTWVIGNEIERPDWGSDTACNRQDEILPEVYAQAYHDLYTLIKTADPSAQIALGGMVEFTDLRRDYLERIWTEYQSLFGTAMPVDVWNIHAYILPEVRGSWGAEIPVGLSQNSGALYTIQDNKDFSKVWAQIVALRTWMKNHGQQNKPLIITEYGVNMPSHLAGFSPVEVRDSMMYPSFNAFLNTADANLGYPADGYRLVQRWNWWSMDADDGECDTGVFYEYFGGSLFHSSLGPSSPPTNCSYPAKGLSELGLYWKQYVQDLPSAANPPYLP